MSCLVGVPKLFKRSCWGTKTICQMLAGFRNFLNSSKTSSALLPGIENDYSLTFFFYIESKVERGLMFFYLSSQDLRIITQPIPLEIIIFVPSFKLTKSKYRITISASKLWNIILNIERRLISLIHI